MYYLFVDVLKHNDNFVVLSSSYYIYLISDLENELRNSKYCIMMVITIEDITFLYLLVGLVLLLYYN